MASINSQQHVCDILEQCNSKDKEVGNVPVSEVLNLMNINQ